MIPMPREVTDVNMAFGPALFSDLAPAMEDIPEEFKYDRNNKWNEFLRSWFLSGFPTDPVLLKKEGVDANLAYRHIHTMLKSYQPKHQHKMAACAYLLSLWFEDIVPASAVEKEA